MRKIFIIGSMIAAALALGGWFPHGTVSGGGCSNSLDFSNSCNSAYIAVIL